MTVRLKCLAPRPMAAMRLICIPFAGGGALAFRGWPALLPAQVEAFAVQLPGREDRLREQPFRRWDAMMPALLAACAPLPPLPTAIFGHSLGAVVALELARWMERAQPGRLRQLFVSGRAWPGQRRHARIDPDALDDGALLQALDREYGSLSTNLSHPEIRALGLPALRADLKLLDSHAHADAAPLECPLTVYAGSDDPATATADLQAWRRETRGPFAIRTLQGDHFFIETARERLLADLAAGLAGAVPA